MTSIPGEGFKESVPEVGKVQPAGSGEGFDSILARLRSQELANAPVPQPTPDPGTSAKE